MGMEQEHHFVMVREKSFSQVKADLVHAFLSVRISVYYYKDYKILYGFIFYTEQAIMWWFKFL